MTDKVLEATTFAIELRKNQDSDIKKLSCRTNKHNNCKENIFHTFIEYLKRDTNLSQLSDMVDDPESPWEDVHKFILYTRGYKSRSKFDIINECLICFVRMHKMKKVASGLTDCHRYAYEYQSTTWETMLNLLFSYFAEYGILYKHPKDYSLVKDTYISFLDKKFLIFLRKKTILVLFPIKMFMI